MLSKMLRSLGAAVAALVLALALQTPSRSATLSIDAFPADLVVGDTFDLNVRVSGLGILTGPSLTSYSVLFFFDTDNLLGLTGVSFGTGLGPGSTQSAVVEPIVNPGDGLVVTVSETTALVDAALHALQPEDFLLATVSFEALAAGITTGTASLRSQTFVGRKARIKFKSRSTLEVSPSAVPLPGAFFLLLSALAGVVSFSRWSPLRRCKVEC